MSINKPYYRIYRPGSSYPFLSDSRNVDNMYTYIRAFRLLEDDLVKLFTNVEPTKDNRKVYSHRLYELLLRASTEFETNAMQILTYNGYTKKGNENFNIKDYYKINEATKLSDYEVTCELWHPMKVFKPFQEWCNGHSLSWYQAYNKVKHNRSSEFSKASLENVMNAITGVLAILYAQFDYFAITGPMAIGTWNVSIKNTGDYTEPIGSKSIFHVVRPKWTEDEKYLFNWDEIKNSNDAFAKYPFKKVEAPLKRRPLNDDVNK